LHGVTDKKYFGAGREESLCPSLNRWRYFYLWKCFRSFYTSVTLLKIIQEHNQGRIWRREIGTVAPGPPQNRNRIYRFYWDIYFSEITKSRLYFF
jgi:hypothetical protein